MLRDYFVEFGQVIDSIVIKNNETGRSRGFGFVTFKNRSSIDRVFQSRPHYINGQAIDVKEYLPRNVRRSVRTAANCKIVFVGGLAPTTSEIQIRRCLSTFGQVNDVRIAFNQETNRNRAYGFVTFEFESSVNALCAQRFVNINGKMVECEIARDPKQIRNQNQLNTSDNRNEASSSGHVLTRYNMPPSPYFTPSLIKSDESNIQANSQEKSTQDEGPVDELCEDDDLEESQEFQLPLEDESDGSIIEELLHFPMIEGKAKNLYGMLSYMSVFGLTNLNEVDDPNDVQESGSHIQSSAQTSTTVGTRASGERGRFEVRRDQENRNRNNPRYDNDSHNYRDGSQHAESNRRAERWPRILPS